MYAGKFSPFLKALSLGKPTPGGGSVAALGAACGTGLLCMAGNFILSRQGLGAPNKKIKKVVRSLNLSREKLIKLVDQDIKTYSQVSRAYKLPQDISEERKNKRVFHLQKALRAALKTSASICKESYKAIESVPVIAQESSKALISDVQIGRSFLEVSFKASFMNFKYNLRSLKKLKRFGGLTKEVIALDEVIQSLNRKLQKQPAGC